MHHMQISILATKSISFEGKNISIYWLLNVIQLFIPLHSHVLFITSNNNLYLCYNEYPLFSFNRPYWRCYYSNTDAIIYVVDSADKDRIGISKDELLYMLRVSFIPNFCFYHCPNIFHTSSVHLLTTC